MGGYEGFKQCSNSVFAVLTVFSHQLGCSNTLLYMSAATIGTHLFEYICSAVILIWEYQKVIIIHSKNKTEWNYAVK